MVACAYGAFASSFLSRGVIAASEATSSVDCMQPPASNPRDKKARLRSAIVRCSLPFTRVAPEFAVITERPYPFQQLGGPNRILAATCGRKAAVWPPRGIRNNPTEPVRKDGRATSELQSPD